jgi:hypothetical protein
MSLRFIEGFETYFDDVSQSGNYLSNAYDMTYNRGFSSISGYYGGYALRQLGAGNNLNFVKAKNCVAISGAVLTVALGARFRTNMQAMVNNYSRGIALNYEGYGIGLTIASGILYGGVNSTCNYYSTTYPKGLSYNTQLNDEQWHYAELLISRAIPNTSWFGKLKLDNLVVAQGALTGPTNALLSLNGSVYLYNAGATDEYLDWDDIYVVDGLPTDNFGNPSTISGFIPNAYRCRVMPIYPISDVAGSGEWTPSAGEDHYSLVNEIPDDTDTYISATASGQLDALNYSPIVPDANSIVTVYGVQLQPVAKLTMGTKGSLSPMVNGTKMNPTYLLPSGIPLPITFQQFPCMAENNPSTGIAWTLTGVSGMNAGLQLDYIV